MPFGSFQISDEEALGNAIRFVKDAGATNVSSEVRSSYDLVGFDPRGVKRSAPVTCLTDKERDESRAKTYDLSTDAGLAAALADNKPARFDGGDRPLAVGDAQQRVGLGAPGARQSVWMRGSPLRRIV